MATTAQNFLAGQDNSLAGLMQETGYGVTVDDACFKALMRHLPEPPSEQTVADVLLLMARTHSGLKEPAPGLYSTLWMALGLGSPPPEASAQTIWNWPLVVDCLKSIPSGPSGRLSWLKVAEGLDSERAMLHDGAAFTLLASAFRRGAGEPLPVAALTGRMWKHPQCQLSLLKLAASAPPDVFSFEGSKRLVSPLEGMNVAALSPNRAWASVDLLQVLCILMEGAALVQPARDILQYPAATCPDLLLITIAETRTTWNLLQRDVFAALLPQHLLLVGMAQPPGGAAAAAVAAVKRSRELLARICSAAPPEVLVDLLIELFAQDANQMPRLGKVCVELGILPQVLASAPGPFALELAAYAGNAGLIPLEAWLSDYCNRDTMAAVPAMLRYVMEKTAEPGAGGAGPDGAPGGGANSELRRGVPLTADAARAFLKVLQGLAQGLPVDLLRELQAIQASVARQFPSLAPHITAVSTPDTFASDVEEEANSYFQAIYNESRPIEEIISRMQAYKSSPNPREQEVFACMIHNLFDEYRFFSRYPDRELHITATLFGSLIKHSLVSSITLGMALRYVLDALRKPAPSNMYTFGVEALRQFAHMIAQWPQFLMAVLANGQLREFDPELHARVEQAQQDTGAMPAGLVQPSTGGVGAGPAPPSAQQQQGPAQADAGTGTAPEASALGSSRFLNLQPADGSGPAGPGPDAEAPAAPIAARGGKDAGPTGRGAAVGAPEAALPAGAQGAGKGGGREGNAGGGAGQGPAAAAGGPPASVAAPAPAGGAAAQPSNTSLSMGEGDGCGMILAAQVAAASLAAPMGPSLAALVNTESLESAAEKYRDFKEPPEAAADKVHFVMNNITKDTMESRSVEIRDRVLPDYLAWFANYMVVKRAAQEANFHVLYVSLLDHLGDRELYRLMVNTTMYYVKVLLYSERILKESNDRALLKNLGTWLGLLTYARNKPVLCRDLELKHVICEAYQRGRLIAVLPFVQKLLEGCRSSRVFKPTNPMVAGILSLLAELHAMKGLKMNNAFSIELIFKAFGLSPHDVKPSDTLKTMPRERITNPDWQLELLPPDMQAQAGQDGAAAAAAGAQNAGKPGVQSSPPPSSMPSGIMQPPSSPGPASALGIRPPAGVQLVGGAAAPGSMDTAPKGMAAGPAPGGQEQQQLPYGMTGAPQMQGGPPAGGITPAAAVAAAAGAPGAHVSSDGGLFANLHQNVIINPSLGAMAERLVLKRHVPAAVDRAIGEIITPVVERSVTIACYTTYELVLKDFAGDADETRLRKAAHLMVSSLAGSLSLVTAKDPLRISLTNQLRQMLQAQVPDNGMLEQLISVLVNDNLDLGCTLIEKAATDKAVRDIDKSLQAAYEERAKARAAGKPWVDAAAFHSTGARFPGSLPEGLRPRPGGIQPHHLRVYEDFTRIPKTAPAIPPPGPPGAPPGAVPGVPPGPGVMQPGGVMPPPPPGVGLRPSGAYPSGAPHGSFQGLDALVAAAEKPQMELRSDAAAAAALLDRYLMWQQSVDAAVAAKEANPTSGDQSDLQALLAELSEALGYGAAAPEDAAAFFARRILKHLYDSAAAASGSKLSLSFHAACLELLNSPSPGGRVVAELTAAYLGADDERKFSPLLAEMLLRLRLLSLPDLDSYLAKLLQTPASRTQAVSDLIFFMLRSMAMRDGVVAFTDLPATMELLGRMAVANPPLASMVEAARKAAVAPAQSRSPAEIPSAVRDKAADPPGLRDQTLKLFEEWVQLLNMHAEDKALFIFLTGQVRAAGVLKMDDTTDRFLRTLTELAVAHCLASAEAAAAAAANSGARQDAAGAGPLSFIATDALVSLVAALVVTLNGGEALLNRYLALLVGLIKRDADEASIKFNARPYLRIWVGLMSELGVVPGSHAAAALAAAAAADPSAGAPPVAADPAAQMRYLRACGVALHALQPLSVPGFAFGWLELIAHRSFMPRVLTAQLASGWPLFASLLIALLRFLEPYLRAADLSESIKQLYKGCLRLLLVLLHDFPEFLCEHHFSLCEAIPAPAVQMRNLVLSAFPRNMRLPDPFTPNLKVDLLPEIQQLPRIVPDPELLLPEALRQQVDAFLRSRTPPNLPQELAKRAMMSGPADKAGSPGGPGAGAGSYNVPLINALVLYIGSQAKTVSSPLHPGAQEMYVRMAGELDAEGRYLLLNAMANQLRYPNAHTYYFSCTLLTLFLESKSEGLKEQITRTLLERLIVNRPHPWGLLITFIELIKNRRYNFWAHGFTKCAPEIENLFTSVSRSCLGTNRAEEEAAAAAHAKEGVAVRV